jgi:hypothetical protein
MNTNEAASPRFGKLECAVGALTALVLAGILAALAYDLNWFSAADPTLHMSAAESRPAEKQPSHKANASPETAKAKGPKEVASEHEGAPVGEAKLTPTPTQAEAQEPPPAPAPAAAHPAPPPAHDWVSLLQAFIGKTILALALLVVLATIAGLVFVHYLFNLIRRHKLRFGPLIRVEYSAPPVHVEYSAPPVNVGPFNTNTVGPFNTNTVGPLNTNTLGVTEAAQEAGTGALERAGKLEPGQPETAADHTAEKFDLGPSFETQRRLKEAEAKRMEEAVLQQFFEDNLKLQAQIKSKGAGITDQESVARDQEFSVTSVT